MAGEAETEPSDAERWLIVRPAAAADDRLPPLLQGLARLGLDPFGARQRLIGQAPALLARGRGEKLTQAAALLAAHRIPHALILPTAPRFAPERVFAVACRSDALVFTLRGGELVISRGTPVVAILADLSGRMPQKLMQRLLAQNAYRGAEHIVPAGEEEVCREILRGEPVLDLYPLSAAGEVERAVRLFPGKFDPKGLGEKASLSAAGNLQAVLESLQQITPCRPHTGFGLATLPGCLPLSPEPGMDRRRENLANLTRFGWLMADLEKTGWAGEEMASAQPAAAECPEAAAAARLVPAGTAAGRESGPEREDRTAPPAGLPAPPDMEPETGAPFSHWRAWAGGSVGILVGLMLAGGHPLFAELWFGGLRSGIFPAVLSLGLFLAGARVLGRKRQIENMPTSRVRSLAMGMVEVHGRAVRQYALVSPMTQMACVWYRLRWYRRDGDRWRLTSTRSSGSLSFLLDDGTGRVRIEPAGAAVRGGSREEGYGSAGGFLLSGDRSGPAEERWVEEAVAEGTYLYILGYAREEEGPRASLAERTREKLRRLKADLPALGRFDADGDGSISAEEWDSARSEMERDALREQLTAAAGGRPGAARAVIGRPPGRSLPFIIAETPTESRLAGRYGITAAALLAGALLAAGWAAAVVLPFFIA